MKITKDTNIGVLVAENYQTASIFNAHKIDFCCNGNRSLETACQTIDTSVEELIEELSSLPIGKTETNNYQDWSISFLADYVYNNHHTYIEKTVPEIKKYLAKITSVHGKQHPELQEIKELFIAGADALTMHMKKEELILFPYFKKLDHAKSTNTKAESPQFGTVQNPIAMMHEEHDNEGVRFREISRLSNNYKPPEDACGSYKVTFAMLKDFESDLHKHIHIENNILFKKAILLENQIMN